MFVKEIMTATVKSCRPNDSLATASELMWQNDCGAVPVVDGEGKPQAMVTDRDICMAAFTRGSTLRELQVSDCMSGDVTCCRAEDDVATAARKMMEQRVRRLPVVDASQRIVGILSLNDIAVAAGSRRAAAGEGLAKLAFDVLQASCQHRSAAGRPSAGRGSMQPA